MRTLSPFAAILSSALLAACATSSTPSRYQAELDRLEAQCTARGGILTPTGVTSSNNPALEYACRISGGASRLD